MGARRDALDALLAKQEITEVLHQYCRAQDRDDIELGYDVWHEGGTADYEGMFEGTGREFLDFGHASHGTFFERTNHQVTNVLIDLDGDTASSEAYVTAANTIKGTDLVYVIRGRYLDEWARREDRWRIVHRRFTTDMWQLVPLNHAAMPGPAADV